MNGVSSPLVQKKKPERKRKRLGGIVRAAALCALCLYLVQSFLIQPVRIDGISMEGTLHNGEMLLVSKLPGWLTEPKRGSIVICRFPQRETFSLPLSSSLSLAGHTLFVKRLVALPGDTVEIRDHRLFVNGAWVPDPPHLGSTPRDYPLRRLKEDEYFVVGDHRFLSLDSRSSSVGPLSRDMIFGEGLLVFWPFSAFRPVQ